MMRCLPCTSGKHELCQHLFFDVGDDLERCLCSECSKEQVKEAERRYMKSRESAMERLKKKGGLK